MSEISNGHANGFGSSDDEGGSSSEGEEEEDQDRDGLFSTRVNGGRDVDEDDADDDDHDEADETEEVDVDGDDDPNDDDDDDDDSDSAPEDISFKTGESVFREKSQLQQLQIEKSQTAAKEKRRRRDELLKEQKASKLKKLKASKLSADFLNSLDTSAKSASAVADSEFPPDSAPVSDVCDASESSSAEAKKRRLIPLPDVEGIEFEVVVGRSDADQEIVKKSKSIRKEARSAEISPTVDGQAKTIAKNEEELSQKTTVVKMRMGCFIQERRDERTITAGNWQQQHHKQQQQQFQSSPSADLRRFPPYVWAVGGGASDFRAVHLVF